jgi:hypothetical protein
MRFTFVILLFCCLGADAQMIIKAHANYRPFPVAANLILDTYTGGAAAYSLRKLRTAYTGSAIRVRRSNDNSEQDIGFTSGGDLDTASLKTFVGANSGFITTWYSQGDSSAVNFTQTTAANQPRIVNAGTVERRSGKPSVFFDGSNDFMNVDNSTAKFNFLHRAAPSQISAVTQFGTASDPNNYYVLLDANGTSNSPRGITFFYDDRSFVPRNNMIVFFIAQSVLSINANNYCTPNQVNLLSLLQKNNISTNLKEGRLYLNGGNEFIGTNSLGSGGETGNASFNLRLGRTANSSDGPLLGYVSEIIMWGGVDNTSNRTGIENNINTYYSIY